MFQTLEIFQKSSTKGSTTWSTHVILGHGDNWVLKMRILHRRPIDVDAAVDEALKHQGMWKETRRGLEASYTLVGQSGTVWIKDLRPVEDTRPVPPVPPVPPTPPQPDGDDDDDDDQESPGWLDAIFGGVK